MALTFPLDRFAQLQQAIAGMLSAIPFFNGVSIFIATPTVQPDGSIVASPEIQTKVEQALTGITSRGGMTGVAIMIGPPVISMFDHKSNTAMETTSLGVRVIENPLFNYASNGTFISAVEYAYQMVNYLHAWKPGQQWGTYGLRGQEGKTCVPVVDYDRPSYRQYDAFFFVYLTGIPQQRTATPFITPNAPGVGGGLFLTGSTATITCATAGASIYYTTDGTFPQPGNSRATLYTMPVFISSATILKAMAYSENLAPSDEFDVFTSANATEFYYLRPDGTSFYLRPDGVSKYVRP